MIPFILGILLSFATAYAWVFSRFYLLRQQVCMTCGRPASTVAQIIDLETHKVVTYSLLCEWCMRRGGWNWK